MPFHYPQFKNEPALTSRLWTSREVAYYYGFSPSTISQWRKQGKIPFIVLQNGQYRYNIEQVKAALETKIS